MKRILTVMILVCVYMHGNSQGIFKTADDFKNNRLSYSSSTITANRLFNSSLVRVTSDESSLKLEKSVLYGYQDKKKQNFRFFEKENYRIVSHQPFMVYSREIYHVKGKEKRRITKHYFSVDAQAPVQELTILNLKKAWPMAHDFHDLLDHHFPGDRHLMKYDTFREEYTLLRIFDQTANDKS